MKKMFSVVVIVVLMMLVLAVPVLALQDNPPVTPENLILLGVVASALTWGLQILATYANYQPGRVIVNLVLFAISLLFAVKWAGIAFPPSPSDVGEIYGWLNAVFVLAMPVLGSASFIYNLLYSKVIVPLTYRFAKV